MNHKQSMDVKKYYEEEYLKYIEDANKQFKREFINQNCVVPDWKKYIKNKKILELGGGAGYFSRYINNSCFLINADLSFPFLKIAKEKYEVLCVQADINKLPFKINYFDVIMSNGVLVYLDSASFNNLIKTCFYLLKKEGYLLFNEPLWYVRWFKTYLRLLRLDFLEGVTSELYQYIAKIRGLVKNDGTIYNRCHPDLYIKKKKDYVVCLKNNGFSDIFIRPTVINLAPPSIENHFLKITYKLAPYLQLIRNNVCNYLYVVAKKSSLRK